MKRMSRCHRTVAIGMAVLSNACYTYIPNGPATGLMADSKVAARLTTRASADYEGRIGADVERVEGIVSRSSADSIELRVTRTRNRDGDWTSWSGERVAFGVNDFSSVGQRQFSRTRTILAASAFIAAAVAFLTTDLFGIGDDRTTDPRPIPPEIPG